MSIEQLELILCDMYQMDAWYPPLFSKQKQEFKKASYSQWAVDELKIYIADRLYPKTVAPIERYIEITRDFISDVSYYARLNSKNSLPFLIARDMALDIQDLFHAMN